MEEGRGSEYDVSFYERSFFNIYGAIRVDGIGFVTGVVEERGESAHLYFGDTFRKISGKKFQHTIYKYKI